MKFELSTGAVLATAVLATAALAQEQQPAPQAPVVSDKPTFVLSMPTSIPFVLRDNLVTIDTIVNGQRQQSVLDSGAAAMIVDQGFARNIGLIEGQSAGDVAGGGAQTQQLYPVDISSLIAGPLRFDHVPAYSVNLEQLSSSAGFPINLLIGAPAFKYGAVTVDYKRSRVTFGPSGSTGKCAAPIPLAIVDDAPVIEVELRHTLDSKPIRLKLVVDLGTRHSALMIAGPFVRSETGKALMRSGVAQQVGHGIGGEMQGRVSRVAELRLGQTSIANMEVALTAGSPTFEAGIVDGTLGVPFWKEGVITFDYPAKSLCIER
jgi:hypothetical protein